MLLRVLTPERLHVRHGHAQDRQLVRFPRQSAARGHHVGQLRDVGRHLVAPPPLNLAMVLPTVVSNRHEPPGNYKATTNGQLMV